MSYKSPFGAPTPSPSTPTAPETSGGYKSPFVSPAPDPKPAAPAAPAAPSLLSRAFNAVGGDKLVAAVEHPLQTLAPAKLFPEVGGNAVLHPIETFKNIANQVKTSAQSATQNLLDSAAQFKETTIDNTGRPTAEKVGTTLNLLHSIAGFAMLPVSETYNIASSLPVIKPAADAIGVLFNKTGQLAGFSAEKLVDHLPISQQAKNALAAPVKNIATLSGQILLGGFIYERVTGAMEASPEKTLSPAQEGAIIHEAQTKANELQTHQASLMTPTDVRSSTIDSVTDRATALQNLDPKDPNYAQKRAIAQEFLNREIQKLGSDTTSARKTKPAVPPTAPQATGYVSPFATEGATGPPAAVIPKVMPVEGTGETKVSGLAKSVEAKAVENKLTAGFGDLPEYQTLNMKDQAQRSTEFLSTDYERAKRVALGQEAPPKDLHPESVLVAVENRATKEGDVATLHALATQSGLNPEATTMGQRIRILAERDPESPVGAIKDIADAREKAALKRLKVSDIGKARKAVVDDIKAEIKKATSTKQTWTDFVRDIQC